MDIGKSKAIAGVGVIFSRWDGSKWEDLAEIVTVSGPTMTREFIDVTSLSSTGGYKEFITGFRDAGTVTLGMNFRRDTYSLLKRDFEDNAPKNYEIIIPDEDITSLEFVGLVTELPLEISATDKISANATIKLTGKVKLNSGSGSGPDEND